MFAAIGVFASVTGAYAATETDSFGVTITIESDCKITTTNTLDFGTQGVLTAAVDATSTLGVVCTPSTAYDIGLNTGGGSGATTTTRKMTGGGATIDYQMFQDAAHTTNWGDTVSTDTVSGTGTGTEQSFTVYGRVPAQTTPATGTYTDTVTVTVTF
jgi:spore coat protein U-like protein